MAQFVLVNVVVAVLMKHLEESHHQMDEDEDFEIDQEIAREIEAERRALAEAIERRQREKNLKVRRPLLKMASLPSNFTFTFAGPVTPLTPPYVINTEQNKQNPNSKNRSLRKKKKPFHHHHHNSSISLNDEPPKSATILNSGGNYFNFPCQQSTDKLTKLNGILKKSHSLRVAKTAADRYRIQTNSNHNCGEQKALLVKMAKFDHDDENGVGNCDRYWPSSRSMTDNFNYHYCSLNKSSNAIDEPSRSLQLSNDNDDFQSSRIIDLTDHHHHHDHEQSSIMQSPPVMIKIDDYYRTSNDDDKNQTNRIKCNENSIHQKSEIVIDHASGSGGGGGGLHHLGGDLLTTTVATTTIASPSRNVSTKYRKLSDFLDEESGPLSPALFGTYPELFNSDAANTYNDYNEDDDLNEDDDQQPKRNNEENTSLASIESWPSGDPEDD